MLLATCFLELSDWALVASRATVCIAALSVVALSATQIYRILKGKRRSVVPLPLPPFVFFWSVVFLSIATYLLFSCGKLQYGFMAPTYIASIAWTVGGLSAILWSGIREHDRAAAEAARFRDSLKGVIDQIETGG